MKRLLFPVLLGGLALLLTACPLTPPPPPPPPPSSGCTPTPTGQALALAASLEAPAGLGDFFAPHVPGELLVLPGGVLPQSLTARVQGVRPLALLENGFLHVQVPEGQEKAKAEALLRAGARFVQPNYLYFPLGTPNDPLYSPYQRDLLQLMGLEAAWDRVTGDPQLILAVVDTGYLPHEDMDSRWYRPPGQKLDLADDDFDPTDDIPSSKNHGHGLAVASVLGAATDNSLGIAGVTWSGRVLPLKVARSGDGEITYTALDAALQKAKDLGARVVNLSLGGPATDSALGVTLSNLRSSGVVVVAAAGNDGAEGILYPARDPSVIAVGSVDGAKRKSSFSNCGPELDLVAPGEGVQVAFKSGGYGSASGTSFASPMVAGVAALYMSRYFSLRGVWPSPDQVLTCLTSTAEDLGPPGHDTGYGFGLVRADRVMTDTTYCFP
ncbi:S8 family peptidase [Thermus filiformis]|uniref:Serine protease n=1 Tax=Thermus filiformis TaxID=276 RepID=A0A0D6XCP5_THEFI|nr:S8 family serine peptidase [Thermus filiformis]KIX84653.1 serine protease [Thermus filiformis]